IGYLVDVADPEALADHLPGADRVFASIDTPALAGAAFVVVGTMGDADEEAVLRALALEPAYIGVIASRRRYAALREALVARGVPTEALARIANPAGLDLGAREPGEIAVSILAQMVARRNAIAAVSEAAAPRRAPVPVMAVAAATAIDPVCKMTVAIEGAGDFAGGGGGNWDFCCSGREEKVLGA